MSNCYKKILTSMRKENRNKIYKDNLKQLDIKLKSFSEKYDFEENYIKQILFNNIFVLDRFTKEPLKQNIFESLCKNEICKIDQVKDFVILPKRSNNDSIYIVKGQIIKGKKNLTSIDATKSVDFNFKYKDYDCYITHKYTDTNGGHQKNQLLDVKFFIKNASYCSNNKLLFIAILDGDYYENKILELRKLTNLKNIIICKTEDLEKELLKF